MLKLSSVVSWHLMKYGKNLQLSVHVLFIIIIIINLLSSKSHNVCFGTTFSESNFVVQESPL